jgi:hypothetical protein
MLAILLGLSWLVLTPACVWLLFGRPRVLPGGSHRGLHAEPQRTGARPTGAPTGTQPARTQPAGVRRVWPRRVVAAVALVSLQATTMVIGFTEDTPPALTGAAVLGSRRATGSASDTAPDSATDSAAGPAASGRGGVADGRATTAPGATRAAGGASASCASRIPAPEAVRLSLRGRALEGITVYWPAAVAECGIAAVALHQAGRRLRLWLHEGAPRRHHEGMQTLPVHVDAGTASLSLRLARPIRRQGPYVAVNGHTGHPIPQRPAHGGA